MEERRLVLERGVGERERGGGREGGSKGERGRVGGKGRDKPSLKSASRQKNRCLYIVTLSEACPSAIGGHAAAAKALL